ncbi:MAG: HAMP domain-containing sensor histidine kinase [Lentilactobacillus hilgardii]|uniref:sensor histidine kinase n=1 Tax=Lentilactobacillus hilgardii TaxID=1588 RepID=UPI001DDCB8B4|nr:HAMP domain-containing sensor histidine kinase [Lentilactobacillus hilgardii]MBZ2201825.1 two-component sensor histidine kinase [Lentilactobacillus hilgardii]MBZ2204742.1 sensor histidine kinase [Lentilactobacillus hilgardii]MCT3399398.1 sensor histidine kinase [Lentilactobacillus hilgardii]
MPIIKVRGVKMKRKKPQMTTTSQEIQHSFRVLFIWFAFLMSLAVVGVVGVQLVHQRQAESIELLGSLKRSIIDDRPDWEQWRKNSTINTQNTYVKVNDRTRNIPTKFYSHGTKTFLKAKQIHLPFFRALTYVDGYGFMYYRSGSKLGIMSQIWLSLNPVVNVLLSVIIVVFSLFLLSLLFGWYFISSTAKRLTQPISQLSQTARDQSKSELEYETLLPVPKTPMEVKQLTTSFNELLTSINHKNQQEKTFISNAAHELRTPIAAIRGHIQLVQRHGRDHPEIVDRSIQFINNESARMQTLVNDLLALSRADRGDVKLDYIDLTSLLNETVEEQRAVLKQTINVNIPTKAVVYANADNVQQILSALLDNAGKYSPADSQITVVLSQHGSQYSLSVQNTGPSIPDNQKDQIFERFYRGDQAHNHQVSGTGLGLSIVKQLAELNHIQITVTDLKPQGSRFNLLFNNPENQN